MNHETPPSRASSLLIWLLVIVASGVGIAAAALLTQWMLPRGHEAVWVWELRTETVPILPWTLPAVVVMLVVALVGLDGLRTGVAPTRPKCAVLVICLTLACESLMVSMAVDERDFPFRTSAATLGNMTMGYYLEAARLSSPQEWIMDVATRTDRTQVPERVATHPPGPVLYYWAARQWMLAHPAVVERLQRRLENWSGDEGLEASVALARRVATFRPGPADVTMAFWPGLLLTLTAPLIVPLMFGLGSLAGGRRLGMTAAIFSCAIPSLICFNPSVDGLGAVLGALAMLLWMWSLRAARFGLPAAVCGCVWAVALFWSFGLTALAAVFVVLGAVWWRDLPPQMRMPIRHAVWVAAGMLLVTLGGYFALGYNPLTSVRGSFAVQEAVMQQRPYAPSVIWNLYDFALLAGPTLVLAGIVGTLMALAKSHRPRVVGGLGLGVAATLAVLALAARTRGEVGRIWGFLMPFLAVPAGVPILRLRGWNLIAAGLLLLVGQLSLVLAINSILLLVGP